MRELLAYDPDSGALTWRIDRPGRPAGSVAGAIDRQNGRRVISIDGHSQRAHAIAWLHYYGERPAADINPVDGDPSNTAIANLRLATPSQSGAARRLSSRNSSGRKGVSFETARGKFGAMIGHDGRTKRLGRFDTIEDAHAAYAAAARLLYGDFARSE